MVEEMSSVVGGVPNTVEDLPAPVEETPVITDDAEQPAADEALAVLLKQARKYPSLTQRHLPNHQRPLLPLPNNTLKAGR
jgi:hypothetical protein